MIKKNFLNNLDILQKSQPLLAHQLALTDPSDLEFCFTAKNEINLKRNYKDKLYFYHSPDGAQAEAIEWFEALDLSAATVLYVYGVGLGYAYTAANSWLKKNSEHRLIFIEEDLGVLHRLLETEQGARLLQDCQVQLLYIRDLEQGQTLLNDLSWSYFASPFVLSSLKLYELENQEGCAKLFHQLSYHLQRKNGVVHELLQWGQPFFRNFYANLLELPRAYLGNGLFNLFQNVPAIICGAGPSLDKNIDWLPDLKQKALIMAGGSALNALMAKNITPHFGVASDPFPTQYSRVKATQGMKIPFFYQNRLYHEAFQAISGPPLFLKGMEEYEIARWFEEQLGLNSEERVDTGHNVINFSLQIAKALGCNPILLVGVDLALTDQRFYAEGIPADATASEVVMQTDIYGQPIATLWKWLIEAEWIKKFAQNNPEIQIINATEGGLGFQGIDNLSLKQAAVEYLQKDKSELDQIETEILKHPLNSIKRERIQELYREMEQSLNNSLVLLTKLIEVCDEWAPNIPENATEDFLENSPMLSLLQDDLEGEIAYQYLLDTFSQLFSRIHQRTTQDWYSEKYSIKDRILKKLTFYKQKCLFLSKVVINNREFIQNVQNP